MDNRKPIFSKDSEELSCQECFWLIRFPGGDCKCALSYDWPSETSTPDRCAFFILNWHKPKEKSNE